MALRLTRPVAGLLAGLAAACGDRALRPSIDATVVAWLASGQLAALHARCCLSTPVGCLVRHAANGALLLAVTTSQTAHLLTHVVGCCHRAYRSCPLP